jgi:hypothetical protein
LSRLSTDFRVDAAGYAGVLNKQRETPIITLAERRLPVRIRIAVPRGG